MDSRVTILANTDGAENIKSVLSELLKVCLDMRDQLESIKVVLQNVHDTQNKKLKVSTL